MSGGADSSLAWIGLALPLATTGLAVALAPHVTASPGVALAAASAIAVLPAVTALAIASRTPLSGRATLGALALSVAATVALYVHGLTAAWLVPLQNVALVALGHAAGGAVGSRIQHPGHVLPAMVVASAADLVSVLHPSGPTHAIAESDRALGALALAAPILGDAAFTFVLGVGDLVFAALLLGVARKHGVPAWRVALLVTVGAALSLGLAAVTARPIPALPAIGLASVAGVPAFRRLAPRDRPTALAAIVLAAAVVAGLLVRGR